MRSRRCGHCKNLAPVFADAAHTLSKSDPVVQLAKLDATQNEAIAKAYQIQGFPTLKWFVNGTLSVRVACHVGTVPLRLRHFALQDDVPDERSKDGIVRWCTKRSAGAAILVSDASALDEWIQRSRVLVVGFFAAQSGAEYEAFTVAALSRGARRLDFVAVTNPALQQAQVLPRRPRRRAAAPP